MSAPRPAAVAGRFYPDDPIRLAAAVDAHLAAVARPTTGAVPKAIIAPHAGLPYSGPVAASAYARLRTEPPAAVERVVLLGPAHWWPGPGVAAPTASSFRTPLGDVPVDVEAVHLLVRRDLVQLSDEAHARDHALEMQLPFLQRALQPGFRIVPLLVGPVKAERLVPIYEALWGGAETLFVVSSDLSHFHDYDTARRLDGDTTAAIEALDADAIAPSGACGRLPIQGLLRQARRRGLRVAAVDVRSSGDTAGPRDRVVGYGAYVVAGGFGDADRRTLLRTARQAIDYGLREGGPMEVEAARFEESLRLHRACFVTLRTADGGLRGCMGSSQAVRPLIEDVARNAYSAAFLDPRFPPLQAAEADGLRLHLSVLTPLEPLPAASEEELLALVRPGVDGLLVEEGQRRGTLLPSVWDSLPDPRRFLTEVRRKAGLAGDYWSPTLRIFRYTAESIE